MGNAFAASFKEDQITRDNLFVTTKVRSFELPTEAARSGSFPLLVIAHTSERCYDIPTYLAACESGIAL